MYTAARLKRLPPHTLPTPLAQHIKIDMHQGIAVHARNTGLEHSITGAGPTFGSPSLSSTPTTG
eukprot:12811959-Prorocentrum_lima.AAC.1